LNVIKKLYNLPEKFFYLPNQFWKHKNHELVFQAVKALKEKGEKILIVCTGSPFDYRHPGYHTQLFNKVSQWNLHDNIIYLGLVPREHVLLFIRQSICVLNPSLFEGFSMTVEEAESVGKQLLISDIPVHRERKLSKVTFFNPRDCGDLMEKLNKIWHDTLPGPDIELELKARQELPNRLRSCAEAFIKIAKEKDN
jgi:glycosyltransferase involved in cell wall biosynthesis